MSLASEVAKDRGQPSTVRIGTIVGTNPLQVSIQGRVFNRVGVLASYNPQVNDVVAVVGQSAISADGSSWLVLGHAEQQDLAVARMGVLATGLRTTNSSTTTTEVGVLRLDNIPLFAGRFIRVSTGSSLIFNSTVANDLIEARLYLSVTGVAVVGGTQFSALSIQSRTAGGAQYTDGVSGFIVSSARQTLSVLLSVARTAGTGTVGIVASNTYPTWLVVEDLGVNPGNTGVLI